MCVGDLLDTVNHLLFLAGRVSQETVILDNEAVRGRKHITFPGYSHQVGPMSLIIGSTLKK